MSPCLHPACAPAPETLGCCGEVFRARALEQLRAHAGFLQTRVRACFSDQTYPPDALGSAPAQHSDRAPLAQLPSLDPRNRARLPSVLRVLSAVGPPAASAAETPGLRRPLSWPPAASRSSGARTQALAPTEPTASLKSPAAGVLQPPLPTPSPRGANTASQGRRLDLWVSRARCSLHMHTHACYTRSSCPGYCGSAGIEPGELPAYCGSSLRNVS